MNTFKKIVSLMLALMVVMGCVSAVSAAPVAEATIDQSRKGSLTLYKYDLTNAEKDKVWDSSYVSTGVYDENVNNQLGQDRHGDTDNDSDLGNGEVSYGYAIRGVEFTYVRIADIVQFTESAADGITGNHVEVLYGIDKDKGADFLKAIGLANGANRYKNAENSGKLDQSKYYYQSDVLINALAASLEANSTTVKNALENYVLNNNGISMPKTDAYGKTGADNLDLGLYLMVETEVPEMVTCTTDPFLVSVPMTSVNGTNATDGGTRWIYDITLYPKNLTGIPSLEKTLRENINDTGKNGGSSSDITDGYAHTGTASAGDVIDYQIISTLPSITSETTYLTTYSFVDNLSAGLSYNKGDVVLEFFSDDACTKKVATWREADKKFTVSYNTTAGGASVMTIDMTAAGLKEINTAGTVYTSADMVNSGYSDCTLRITYQATVDSDNSVVYGDKGNPNDVVMTWKRSNTSYYDTLVDDCHLYVYGIDLTKEFSDGAGNFANVEFLVHNDTDNYYVVAKLNEAEGIYYVTEHVEAEADATHFIPVSSNGNPGKIIIKGLEDDQYTLTEVRTDNGYTLLKDDITVVISQVETEGICDIYGTDVKGLLQNDPRFAEILNAGYEVNNVPQKHMEHHLLTASAAVDGNPVTMLEDNGSVNAHAPLIVTNTRGFDLPATGDNGTWMFSVMGILAMTAAAGVVIFTMRKRENA